MSEKVSKLAIYFPGIGYHCDKPLLYYSRSLARELGYKEYRNISYTYEGKNIRGNQAKMQEAYEILFRQAEEELKDIDWSVYDEILFVSKSIGTVIASSYAEKYGLIGVKHVLYTPLAETFLFAPDQGIAFIGTADPWSSTEKIIQLARKKRLPLYVYDDCNHSLECGDTERNIDILRDVMEKTKEFLLESRKENEMQP